MNRMYNWFIKRLASHAGSSPQNRKERREKAKSIKRMAKS